MIFAPAILASAAIDSDCADTVPGLRTTMYWFGIFSVVAVACISDPVIVPNGSESDSGGVGDDVSDGVASRNGSCLSCSFSSCADKAIAFGMSNNDDLWNMDEYDMAVAMIKKVNAEKEIKNLFT